MSAPHRRRAVGSLGAVRAARAGRARGHRCCDLPSRGLEPRRACCRRTRRAAARAARAPFRQRARGVAECPRCGEPRGVLPRDERPASRARPSTAVSTWWSPADTLRAGCRQALTSPRPRAAGDLDAARVASARALPGRRNPAVPAAEVAAALRRAAGAEADRLADARLSLESLPRRAGTSGRPRSIRSLAGRELEAWARRTAPRGRRAGARLRLERSRDARARPAPGAATSSCVACMSEFLGPPGRPRRRALRQSRARARDLRAAASNS